MKKKVDQEQGQKYLSDFPPPEDFFGMSLAY
jgi:hypothetical protein